MSPRQNFSNEIFLEKPDSLVKYNFLTFLDKNSYYFNFTSYNKLPFLQFLTNPLLEKDFSLNSPEFFEENPSKSFQHLNKCSIKSFFTAQRIDIPTFFKKSKSLYSTVYEMPLLKVINIIMRKGLKAKVLRVLGSNFFRFFTTLQSNLTPLTFVNWKPVHFFLNKLLITSKVSYLNPTFPDETPLEIQYGNTFFSNGLSFNATNSFEYLFFELIKDYFPIFNFAVRKVDKSVRKNSRGRSGKYVIVWKYIPAYKRLYTTLRWFLQDLKFQKNRTFMERFKRILETLMLTPHLSLVCKTRRFVHAYVFHNLKNKLMRNLKTTS